MEEHLAHIAGSIDAIEFWLKLGMAAILASYIFGNNKRRCYMYDKEDY